MAGPSGIVRGLSGIQNSMRDRETAKRQAALDALSESQKEQEHMFRAAVEARMAEQGQQTLAQSAARDASAAADKATDNDRLAVAQRLTAMQHQSDPTRHQQKEFPGVADSELTDVGDLEQALAKDPRAVSNIPGAPEGQAPLAFPAAPQRKAKLVEAGGKLGEALQKRINQTQANKVEAARAGKRTGSGPEDSGLTPGQFETQVNKYGKAIGEFSGAQNDIDYLNGQLNQKDIPGVGPIDGRVPDMLNFLRSNKANENIQRRQDVTNKIIYAVSGKAINDKEFPRIQKSYGLHPGATEEEFKLGAKRLLEDYQNKFNDTRGSYHPSVVGAYEKRGGFQGQGPRVQPGASVPARPTFTPPGGAPAGAPAPAGGGAAGQFVGQTRTSKRTQKTDRWDGQKWVPVG